MSRHFPSPATAAVLLILTGSLLVSACADGGDTVAPATDSALAAAPQSSHGAIRANTDVITDLVATATATWNAMDAAAYAAIYAEDMQLVNPIGGRSFGRAAFEAQHAFLFNGPFAGSTHTIDLVDVIFLTGTIALVLQDVTLTGYAFLPPNLPSSDGVVRTRVAWVVVKRGGEWQIVYQHMTPQL